MKIGILALQGDFAEHASVLERLGVDSSLVRLPDHLAGLDGLIIPGGESTTIGKLAEAYDLIKPMRDFAAQRPVWGTCAGAIFLSKDARRQQPLLEVMDITVERNAFGRQVDSFETDVRVSDLGEEPFHAVFIRAPLIERTGMGTEVLARLEDGTAVAVRQKNLLGTAFHPELTEDERFHRYFLQCAL